MNLFKNINIYNYINMDLISFDDLVIRDLHKKYYQVQPARNICKIVYIDTYELPPIALIVEKQFDDITCKLLSYLISEEQINNNVLLTIGWLVYKDENLIAQIDCLFIPDEIINMSDFNSKIFRGKFQIWNKYKKFELLEEYNEMPSINKLYELLLLQLKKYE